MALLFCDSVRHYSTSARIIEKWTNSTSYISTINGRNNGPAILVFYGSYLYKTVAVSSSTVICGFRLKLSRIFAGRLISFGDDTNAQIAVFIKSDGTLQAYKGDLTTTIGSSSTNAIQNNTLYYIECKAFINDTTGTLEVRVNGSSTGWLNLTGIDTQATANATANTLLFSSTNDISDQRYICDIYFANNSGSTNNDFLGEVNVDAYLPNGAGNYSQLTASSGSNYACVDETDPNTTDYVSSGTAGHIDTYTFTDMDGNNPQIKAVVNNLWALKTDSGTVYAKSKYRRSSTDYNGSNLTPSTTYQCLQHIYETDPATSSSWTKTNLNNSEFGMEVATS